VENGLKAFEEGRHIRRWFFQKGILGLFRRLGIYNRDWGLYYSRKGLNRGETFGRAVLIRDGAY
jgi:hypothetical protein